MILGCRRVGGFAMAQIPEIFFAAQQVGGMAMDTEMRISALGRTSFFAGVGRETLVAAATSASEHAFVHDERLFHQGEEATHSYLLMSGRVRLDQATDVGGNVVLRFLGPGDMVGTVAVVRGRPYPATPVAIQSGAALIWSAAETARLIASDVIVANNLIEMIGGRFDELQKRVEELATFRVERRVAATLLRMITESGRTVDNGIEIPFAVSRNEIAEMTGTTLHSVSRTLSAWEQNGLLSGKRANHIVVFRRDELERIVGAD